MSDILNPETLAWEGRAWVPKDDYLALKKELADHMWWERTAVQLQVERAECVAALQGLMPDGWDDGTMDHMPGIKTARLVLKRFAPSAQQEELK